MMKEIRARGPIVVSIEPPYELAFYKEGIFHTSNFQIEIENDPSNNTIRDN